MPYPISRCPTCGAYARWDSRAEFGKFAADLRTEGRLNLVIGLGEFGLAVVCLGLAPFLMAFGVIGPLALVLIFMFWLVADGARRVGLSGSIDRFLLAGTVGSTPETVA